MARIGGSVGALKHGGDRSDVCMSWKGVRGLSLGPEVVRVLVKTMRIMVVRVGAESLGV